MRICEHISFHSRLNIPDMQFHMKFVVNITRYELFIVMWKLEWRYRTTVSLEVIYIKSLNGVPKFNSFITWGGSYIVSTLRKRNSIYSGFVAFKSHYILKGFCIPGFYRFVIRSWHNHFTIPRITNRCDPVAVHFN